MYHVFSINIHLLLFSFNHRISFGSVVGCCNDRSVDELRAFFKALLFFFLLNVFLFYFI